MGGEIFAVVLKLLAVVGLVGLNGFFVATEFSLVSVRRSRIEAMAAQGHAQAKPVLYALKNLDGYIAATQLGITIASLGLGWVGEPTLAALLDPIFEDIVPPSAAIVSAHAISFAIAFSVITTMHVVFGELAPKSVALQYPERIAMLVAAPTTIFLKIFSPIIAMMNGLGRAFLNIVGVQEADVHDQIYSQEELSLIVAASQEGGQLVDLEREIIQRALMFHDQTAEEIMVPRTELIVIPITASLNEIREFVTDTPFNRYPIHRQDIDEIVGVLYVRDILHMLVDPAPNHAFDLQDVMRPAHLVPESIQIDELFEELKREYTHAAVIIDEYGGTAGMVTIEDIIERFVGKVPDEYHERQGLQDRSAGGVAVLSGLTPIVDVNEQFGLDITPGSTYKTIGGYVFAEIGERPEIGDTVEIDGYELRVERLDGMRIADVRITPPTLVTSLGS